MFMSRQIAETMNVSTPPDAQTIVRYVLTNHRLSFEPGQAYAYSNFGYCLLGRVIESITGLSYEAAVQRHVLAPMGIPGMQIGRMRRDRRASDEVQYYAAPKASPVASVFDPAACGAEPEVGFYLPAMDAHGGWVGSPIDLVTFLLHVDGRGPIDDLLSSKSIDRMTARPAVAHWRDKAVYYAAGWQVRPKPDHWWHAGSLPGSAGILVRSGQDGLGWAALFNARSNDKTDQFMAELDQTIWRGINRVSRWPSHDLFARYG
jgi:CubicO group peptidase (beta-lactamase class C family)